MNLCHMWSCHYLQKVNSSNCMEHRFLQIRSISGFFFSITFTFALNNYSKYYPTCLNFLHSGCQMFHNVPDNCTNSCSERYKWYLWLSPVSADMICHSWLPWILLLYRTIPMIYSESLKASGHPAGSGIEQSHQQSQCQSSSLPNYQKGDFS